ncbi:MAG: hypothetical protein A3J55_03960 [Candidatus Ryanbacteria bacterium RIFCSPHIGHO2_02_FULL_45_17b]|uniref:Uncharacterized protein n=1 Tax=Candidatus Ryanbacteria bacterium RIFCSPHIGHO2_01_FULL_45_22 TaxID=1802114 RepID=A0A1G2FY88_9BACT|nr:MAG: hypothetical protein A2719_02100 [Candidatus Ryanbacteria bacterium RIFCSPHIGHO2_01_FULL_45_22]OGZ46432.1 MAG: hypothetical protein A3J55_03960 [Candidatus Ryanbacteria bacterium RIFCSPHIGHO2_02_FULL_45_17b]
MNMIRNRAWRRYQVLRHMRRRLKEDRNQHYNDLLCPCWGNARRYQKGESRLTVQERREFEEDVLSI